MTNGCAWVFITVRSAVAHEYAWSKAWILNTAGSGCVVKWNSGSVCKAEH